MIQVNLLPDVKTRYIAAQRKKRMMLVTCTVISGVAIGALLILLSATVAQNTLLANADKTAKKNLSKLNGIQDLDKILTVQNQLNSLGTLHSDKPVVSRIFTLLPQITPNSVQISKVDLGLEEPTMGIEGTANSLTDANKFIDTLKFTKVSLDGGQTQSPAFTAVVLSSFGKDDKGKASFNLTLKYDDSLFKSSNSNVQLIVPKITSTRSEVERPNSLFIEQAEQTSAEQGQQQ